MAERERRTTAGKRMNFLTGQALEDDEAFWGHDTWESDNESFHSSDQEEAPDLFDSDFNETEESSDEEEAADAEKEIAEEERKARKRKIGYSEGGLKVGKPPGGSKKFKHGTKRIVGDEHNAGIVLNFPGGPAAGNVPMGGIARPKKAPVVVFPTASVAPALASTRQRRSAREASGYSNKAREAATAAAEETQRKQPPKTTKSKNQEMFQQVDLLLEAANTTEPSNERWLLGRKRTQAEKELSKRDDGTYTNSTYTEKFISRKGYLNTINFADMDHIPNILLQKNQLSIPPKVPLCAVTGKPARYRDPKSGYGYYDLDAFRVVRAKWEEEQATKQKESIAKSKPRKVKNRNGHSSTPTENESHSARDNGKTVQQALNEKKLAAPASAGSSVEMPTKRPGRPKGKTSKEKSSASMSTSLSVGTTSAATSLHPLSTTAPALGSSERPELPQDPSQSNGSIDVSSRKSPRRRKPTARMLESIDEGLLPSSPISPSSEPPALLEPDKDA